MPPTPTWRKVVVSFDYNRLIGLSKSRSVKLHSDHFGSWKELGRGGCARTGEDLEGLLLTKDGDALSRGVVSRYLETETTVVVLAMKC